MELVILGAGPSYSHLPGAVGAAYLVREGDDAILLDLGHGAFSALAREIEPSRLLATAISHLHPDHHIDLIPLRHYLRYELEPRRRGRVIAPAGLADRLDALHAEPGWTAAALDVEPTDGPGIRDLGPFRLEAALVTHTEESYGYRVSLAGGSGPGVVYSGDCGQAEDLLQLIRPGDVVLSEASFGPGPVPEQRIHLDGPAVGRVARAGGASAVLLTHVLARYDRAATANAARAAFGGPVTVVAPGDRFPL
ncbi:MAG: MBL fold metallo-hydrolase [Chloroflexi bacterium]|nr:MBL fold metallo-hydrolase [Chloroflexota bacterium]